MISFSSSLKEISMWLPILKYRLARSARFILLTSSSAISKKSWSLSSLYPRKKVLPIPMYLRFISFSMRASSVTLMNWWGIPSGGSSSGVNRACPTSWPTSRSYTTLLAFSHIGRVSRRVWTLKLAVLTCLCSTIRSSVASSLASCDLISCLTAMWFVSYMDIIRQNLPFPGGHVPVLKLS